MTNLSQKDGTHKNNIHRAVNVHTSVEEITPQKAENWLKRNLQQNRKLSDRHVSYLVNQIKSGHWSLNGESIKFDIHNNLIDGQHRLNAIVKSGTSVHSLIVRGIPTSFFYTIDVGKTRTTGDSLGFKGYKNPLVLSAAVTHHKRTISKWQGKWTKIPAGEVFKFINDNPSFEQSVSYTLKLYKNSKYRGISASPAAALHFMFSKKDYKQSDRFFYKLYSGVDLQAGSPILLLRNKLIDTGVKKLPMKVKIACIIKTWGYVRMNKSVTKIVYNPSRDHFPPII